jgi:phosphatidylinositol glycan class W
VPDSLSETHAWQGTGALHVLLKTHPNMQCLHGDLQQLSSAVQTQQPCKLCCPTCCCRFVSVFRGGVMLTTCLAILGVDFAAFPRRYAKAEGYGTGLMDVGVGAIVWAGGLVSAASAAAAAAAGPAGAAPDVRGAKHGGRSSWLLVWVQRLGRGLRAALPLVVLGGARLVSTAAVGYQHHVGEYGLAWNFFWSIACVSLATLALPVPPAWLGPLGLAVSAAHQAALSMDLGLPALAGAPADVSNSTAAAAVPGLQGRPVPCSLGAWLHAELSAEQRAQLGFLSANKEGLGSLPGYWALHLLGAALGRQLAAGCAAAAGQGRACLAAGASAGGGSSRAAAAVGECARVVWSWVGRLLLADCAVWLALLAAEAWLEPVSRRWG